MYATRTQQPTRKPRTVRQYKPAPKFTRAHAFAIVGAVLAILEFIVLH